MLPLGLLLVFLNWRRLRAVRRHATAVAARATVLETQLAAVAGGYRPLLAHGGAPYATNRPAGARFTGAGPAPELVLYRSRRRWIPVALALGLVIAAAAVYLALDSSALEQKRQPRPAPVPIAPVAVLNAGEKPDAAHDLALDLTRRHVHVVAIGNVQAAPPDSYEVLYTAGDAGQARLLAGILKAQHPHVAPIDAATAQAIGSAPRLVVVIP